MRGIWGLVFATLSAVSATPATASCSCQCVEGVPHTLCNSLEEARANPYACGAGLSRIACPLPPPPNEAPLQYSPPAGAGNCHSARLWDPSSAQYSVVAKVCEAAAAAGSEPVPNEVAPEP